MIFINHCNDLDTIMTGNRICSKCHKLKPEIEYYRYFLKKTGKTMTFPACKECRADKMKIYRQKNKDKWNAARNNKRLSDRDAINAQARAWRVKNRDKVNAYEHDRRIRRRDFMKIKEKRYRDKHKKDLKLRNQWNVFKIKVEVLSHYSNGRVQCQLCGMTNIICLSIDHINGGGNIHRKAIGNILGSRFYRWLRTNNYPKGYRVLCLNCQVIAREDIKNDICG
jgi:hypothetical protein